MTDLAEHLRGELTMVWEEMPMGGHGSAIPDVYAMRKCFRRPESHIYEVKTHREGFDQEIRSEKWRRYLPHAAQFTFAAPDGVIPKWNVPAECGLIVRCGSTWRWAKRAPVRNVVIPNNTLLKLLIDGVARQGPAIRAERYRSLTRGPLAFMRKFGSEAAAWVAARGAEQIEADRAAGRFGIGSNAFHTLAMIAAQKNRPWSPPM